MKSSGSPFDRFYEKGKSHGRSHEGAFIYAAQKYVEVQFEKRGLAYDDQLQGRLARDAFQKYSKEKDRGLPHGASWNLTSEYIRERVTAWDERLEREAVSARRPAGAFDNFDDTNGALPSRYTRRPRAREPEYVPDESRGSRFDEDMRRPRAQAHLTRVPQEEPSPRRQPSPRPTGRGKYDFPAPEYPSDRDPWAKDEYARPAPPMPTGQGKYHFPAPEYPSDSKHHHHHGRAPEPEYTSSSRPRPRYKPEEKGYDNGRGYSAQTQRPRHTDSRARSPEPEPYRDSHRPRYETRGPTSSSSKSHSRPHHETREPPSPSFRRPRTPPPAADDFCGDPKPTKCFYHVLGITRSASADEVKKAYRKISLKHHPDRAGPNAMTVATNKMSEINQANDVLGDAVQRHYYDETGRYKSR